MPRGRQTKDAKKIAELNGGTSEATNTESHEQLIQAQYGNSSITNIFQSLLRKYKYMRIYEEVVIFQYDPQLKQLIVVKRNGRNGNVRFTKNFSSLPQEIQLLIQSCFNTNTPQVIQ